ncbi:hypothetical protein ABLA30_03995 [Xenorhabdus nematophila]|uniref:hypothetical protein n=1 Tax=Xenorhabdus nematophila TaxID=628 RepID=UPI0032B85E97
MGWFTFYDGTFTRKKQSRFAQRTVHFIISASAEFAELKSKMQDGKAVGVNKAKFILYEKINKLCKKRK